MEAEEDAKVTNIYRNIAQNTKTFILFAWPLGVILVMMSLVLFLEDYQTSKAGYLMLPTQKVNSDWVVFVVAALPQVGQIVLFGIWGRDTRKGWAALLAMLFFLADLGTDSWYKSGGSWSLMPLALAESLFIFTLGSEVLFAISVGFVVETFGEFVVAGSVFIRSVMDALGTAAEALGVNDLGERRGEQYRPPQQQR